MQFFFAMKRRSQSNNFTTNEENEGATCSKIGSTHINNYRKFSEEYKAFIFISINVKK